MKSKNIDLGKNKIVKISILLYIFTICIVQADDLDYFGKKIDIRILDKLSSKNKLLKLNIGEEAYAGTIRYFGKEKIFEEKYFEEIFLTQFHKYRLFLYLLKYKYRLNS